MSVKIFWYNSSMICPVAYRSLWRHFTPYTILLVHFYRYTKNFILPIIQSATALICHEIESSIIEREKILSKFASIQSYI